MTVTFKESKAKGEISAPPSKSMAHRYLICGAFSEKSIIKGVDFSKDINATLNCLENLGANIEILGNDVKIGGFNTNFTPENILDCNESGSTLRFLIPIALTLGKEVDFKGSQRLFSRSLSVYEDICKNQGIRFELKKESLTVCGKLKSGVYNVRGDVSSQFITGLMFALSLTEGESVINITEILESGSYIDLTVSALKEFGANIDRKDKRTIIINKSHYVSREITVEGDYSNAAFLDAFNYLGGSVTVNGLSQNSGQGDRVYKEYFELIKNGNPTLDIADCPDLAPVLMAMAAAHNGAEFVGTKRLKIKESDRGNAMKEELGKLGCSVIVEENKITVKGCDLRTPTVPINSHNDHRIVMAMSVLLSVTGGEIEGAEAVSKSYPDFFCDINKLGIEANIS